MSLTTAEKNLVCIYICDSREETAAQLCEALAHIDEPDVRAVAQGALGKLSVMSDMEFSLIFAGVMV